MGIKKSLANLILLALEKSIDGCVRVTDFAYNPHLYLYPYDRQPSKSEIAKTLKRLRERGLIDFVTDQELEIRLTDQGKDRALWQKIKYNQTRWDGKWRLVAFDIPEKRRAARDLLRGKLKYLGFNRLQKSLWASKVDCAKELRDFIRKVGIQDWVVVIEADSVS